MSYGIIYIIPHIDQRHRKLQMNFCLYCRHHIAESVASLPRATIFYFHGKEGNMVSNRFLLKKGNPRDVLYSLVFFAFAWTRSNCTFHPPPAKRPVVQSTTSTLKKTSHKERFAYIIYTNGQETITHWCISECTVRREISLASPRKIAELTDTNTGLRSRVALPTSDVSE